MAIKKFLSFLLILLIVFAFIPLGYATVETRYMRSDTQLINGLTAYKLETSQSASALSVSSQASSITLAATLYPTSTILAGFPNQYPASGYHHDKVDDPAGTPDDDATEVYTSDADSTTYYDRYGHTSYGGSGTIAYVEVTMRGLRVGPSAARGTLRGGFYIGTTYYTFGSTSAAVWTTNAYTWYTNPATGLPWTASDISGLQLAIYGNSKLYGEAYYQVYCTQIYMEVYTYTDATIYYAIDVAKRTSGGTETALGTKVAQWSGLLSGLRSSSGLKSATWACPLTALVSTDSIVVRVYQKVGTGSWNLVRAFTTGQLGAISLDAATWTVYYYLATSTDASYVYTVFWHGTTTYNSRIENFTWTAGAQERSFTFTETMKPSATLNQWQEHKRTFLETILISGNLYGWQEHGYVFIQTITPSETVTIWQEQTYTFTETTVPSSIFNLWQEQMYSFVETVVPSVNLFHWIEMSFSFIETTILDSLFSKIIVFPPTGPSFGMYFLVPYSKLTFLVSDITNYLFYSNVRIEFPVTLKNPNEVEVPITLNQTTVNGNVTLSSISETFTLTPYENRTKVYDVYLPISYTTQKYTTVTEITYTNPMTGVIYVESTIVETEIPPIFFYLQMLVIVISAILGIFLIYKAYKHFSTEEAGEYELSLT